MHLWVWVSNVERITLEIFQVEVRSREDRCNRLKLKQTSQILMAYNVGVFM
jgi:hypothetical protein